MTNDQGQRTVSGGGHGEVTLRRRKLVLKFIMENEVVSPVLKPYPVSGGKSVVGAVE
jgi:hypothetical protein